MADNLLCVKVRIDPRFEQLVDVGTTVTLDGGPPRVVKAKQLGPGSTGYIYVTRPPGDVLQASEQRIYSAGAVDAATNTVALESGAP